ncbi:MAG: FtsB family cell division protein [Solirubrobacteraceae bacterium]|jgi:cell division protein FtsB
MPQARHARTSPHRARTATEPRPRPRSVNTRAPISRVRWDRLGRIALLLVFGLVAVLGIQGAVSFLHTHAQAEQQQAIVRALTRENMKLREQQRSLQSTPTIVQDARKLGMVRPGEQPFVVIAAP